MTFALIHKPAAKPDGVKRASYQVHCATFDILSSMVAAAAADSTGLPACAALSPALRTCYGDVCDLCMALLEPKQVMSSIVGHRVLAFLEFQFLSNPCAVASVTTKQFAAPMLALFDRSLSIDAAKSPTSPQLLSVFLKYVQVRTP